MNLSSFPHSLSIFTARLPGYHKLCNPAVYSAALTPSLMVFSYPNVSVTKNWHFETSRPIALKLNRHGLSGLCPCWFNFKAIKWLVSRVNFVGHFLLEPKVLSEDHWPMITIHPNPNPFCSQSPREAENDTGVSCNMRLKISTAEHVSQARCVFSCSVQIALIFRTSEICQYKSRSNL